MSDDLDVYILGFSIGTSECNLVGLVIVKGLGWKIIATNGLPLGWSICSLLEIWESFLLDIAAGGKMGPPLGCWVGKWLGVHLASIFATHLVLY